MESARSTEVPIQLGFADHLSAIQAAVSLLTDRLRAVDPATAVPTCPDWTVRDLASHVGMVHRWATHIIVNQVTENPDVDVASAPDGDLTSWLTDGSQALVTALSSAPDDLRALTFLKAAPSPKRFWARRQAHETTIHSVDALAAELGRIPTTRETGIDTGLAVDGLDELLTGFLPRRSSALRAQAPMTFVVAATDAPAAWTVRLSDGPPVTVRGSDDEAADAVMTGSAASLYLGLSNRGDEIAVTGEPELLGVWRDKVRIRWS